MKFKTTRKAIVNGGGDIISVGYCDMQHLLHNHAPIAYTCGMYGWNFDVYMVNGKTICTGYRGMPGRDIPNLREYEKKAEAIMYDYKRDYDERMTEIETLLLEAINQ